MRVVRSAPAAAPRRAFAAVVAGCAVWAAIASANPARAAAPPALSVEIPHLRFRLANGLTVVLAEDHRRPLVAVDVWYRIGPAEEAPGRSGFAHLFEHLMFGGSAHVGPDRHGALLDEAGATQWNGATDFDHTRYFETLPSNRLALALWLEADRMGFLRVTQKLLDRERDTVRNERRQTDESTPYGKSNEALVSALFPSGHPYHGNVIGSHEDLAAATLDDVRAFHCAFYGPARATLVVAGDFETSAARALVERYFTTLPAHPCAAPASTSARADAATPKAAIVAPAAARRVVVQEPVALGRVVVGFVTGAAFGPGDAELDVAAHLLGEGRSSRLYRDLVYERKLASSVHCRHEPLARGSVFSCEAIAQLGVDVARLEPALVEAIAALAVHDAQPAQIARARSSLEADAVTSLDELGGTAGKAAVLGYYDHYRDDPGFLGRDLARYREVTPATLRATVERELRVTSAVVVVTQPRGSLPPVPSEPRAVARSSSPSPRARPSAPSSAPAPGPSQRFRAHAPPPSASRALALPAIESFTRPNGLTVWLLERHDLPYVELRVVVPAGDEAQAQAAPGRDGLAAFTAELLLSGSRDGAGTARGSLEVADRFAELGALVAAGAGRESAAVSLGVLRPSLLPGMTQLADVLVRPLFAAAEIERARAEVLADTANGARDPAVAITDVMSALTFGPRHRYGTLHLGTPDSLAPVGTDEVRRFYERRYRPSTAALIAVGDVSRAELERAVAESGLDDWRAPAAAAGRGEAPAAASTNGPADARGDDSSGAAPGSVVFVHAPTITASAASASVTDVVSTAPAARRAAKAAVPSTPSTPSDEAQLQIGFALPLVPRAHADFVPLLVAATCLGGGDTSRLFASLRDRHRYTYGLYASLSPYRDASLLSASGGVRSDATFAALAALRAELGRLVTSPPTSAEVDVARTQLVHGVADQLGTLRGASAFLGQLYALGLPPNSATPLVAALRAVTPPSVARALRAHLHPSRATLFVAFAPDGAAAPVRGAAASRSSALRRLPHLDRDSFARSVPSPPARRDAR